MGSLIPRPCGMGTRLGCGKPHTQAVWYGYEAGVWEASYPGCVVWVRGWGVGRQTLQSPTHHARVGVVRGFLVT